jgi:lipid-A-disaccharide synthase
MSEEKPDAPPRLFVIAGEMSGDAHGARVLEGLRERQPKLIFHGAGGEKMAELCEPPFLNWTDQAVVGLWDVLKNYGYFRRQFQSMLKQIDQTEPDAVLLIDYPGFNLRLAAALKKRRPGQKIIFFISPQVWAWNRGRIPKMARILDLMICIFPFEVDLYKQSGLPTVFVGHPLLEELEHRERGAERDRYRELIGLFPGSRTREVLKIAPAMIGAAEILHQNDPKLRFEIAAAKLEHVTYLEEMLEDSQVREVTEITRGQAHALMQRAGAGMMASGTATLEAAAYGLPYVLVYKVAWMTWVVGKMLVKVDHLGIVNIIAGQEVVPEFLQGDAEPENIAAAVATLIRDEEPRQRMLSELAAVVDTLDRGDAAKRAAEAVADVIRGNE